MQKLNVLIAGQGKYIQTFLRSKYLNKLYATSDKEYKNVITIRFNTFKELAQKCRTLQIDIVIVEEEKWILQGITNVMKQYHINCFAPTSEWTNLALSHNYARKLLKKYEIDIPPKIKLPLEFPVLVKGDGILKKANSMQDIIAIKEDIYNSLPEIAKTIFLEKYINGIKYRVTSLYDGKHIFTFPCHDISSELLNIYSQKLEKMFINEQANFIGFINSELIEENGILYNAGFDYKFILPDFNNMETSYPQDILYICLSAIYQKLNELYIDKP